MSNSVKSNSKAIVLAAGISTALAIATFTTPASAVPLMQLPTAETQTGDNVIQVHDGGAFVGGLIGGIVLDEVIHDANRDRYDDGYDRGYYDGEVHGRAPHYHRLYGRSHPDYHRHNRGGHYYHSHDDYGYHGHGRPPRR